MSDHDENCPCISDDLPFTANLKKWLLDGERGSSSEAIVSIATGVPICGYFKPAPSDPDDLRRCALLLKQAPELRPYLPRMRKVSPGWRRLIDQWDELVALLWEEAEANNGKCPLTYSRMQKALYPRDRQRRRPGIHMERRER